MRLFTVCMPQMLFSVHECLAQVNSRQKPAPEWTVQLADRNSVIDDTPQTLEDEQERCERKRQTVITLVGRVTIDRNQELPVEISLHLLKILK